VYLGGAEKETCKAQIHCSQGISCAAHPSVSHFHRVKQIANKGHLDVRKPSQSAGTVGALLLVTSPRWTCWPDVIFAGEWFRPRIRRPVVSRPKN